jgi:hypothetical protein
MTKAGYAYRSMVAFTGSIALLGVSFMLLYWISLGQLRFVKVFPERNCSQISDNFGSELEKFAYDDYIFVNDKANKGRSSNGTLKCFCQGEMDSAAEGEDVRT